MKRTHLAFLVWAIHLTFQAEGGGESETGDCSWYGTPNNPPPGSPTACDQNESFDRSAMRGAHRNLPCGTRIRVRNLENGRTVLVTINDRHAFRPGVILDLTYGAFGKVQNHDRDVFKCDYKIV